MPALIIALIVAITSSSALRAQDRLLGLITLPEVFGNGPCHPFEPESVRLYANPGDHTALATIQVDHHWSFAPHGGCEGLKVSVRRGETRSDLPTREFSNESPAAIVLAARDRWFKIRLAAAAAWLRASARDRYLPMADLFSEYPSLTALTNAHMGSLLDAPAETAAAVKPAPAAGAPVRVLEERQLGDHAWLHVAVMSHSVCDAERGPPDVVSLGWIRAHAPSGEPAVWFSSRGC